MIWRRRLAVVWLIACGLALAGALVAENWFLGLLAVLAAVGAVLDLRRSRPAAARDRAVQDDDAAAAWPPERVRRLAADHGIAPDAGGRVALVAKLRRAEPRLSLTRAVQLVDAVRRTEQ